MMAVVFGFLGLLVAVPLIATIMVAVKMLYVEDVVGDDVAVPEASSAIYHGTAPRRSATPA